MTNYRKKIPGQPNKSKKEISLWHKWKLTPEEYDSLISNGCSICGSQELLCIDHDHSCCPVTTSRRKTCGSCIRGVLCRRHNLAEGLLNSSVEEVKALLKYLEK